MQKPGETQEALADSLCRTVPGLRFATDLRRLTGGSSHETWAFDGQFEGGEPEPLILRREFSHSLFDMTSQVEFALLSRLYDLGAPVPRPVFQAAADNPLGTPFMVIERVLGTDARKAMAQGDACDPVEQGRSIVAVLADLHALDAAQFADILAVSSSSLDHLEQWALTIRNAAPGGMIAIALDWLERHAFAIGDPVVVHGDYKANNILVDKAGHVTIIDWELAHLGDPLEDLAWTSLWATPADLVGGMMNQSDLFKSYEELARRPIDPKRYRYWQVFALVKLAAIFLKGLDATNGSPRPMLLMLGQAISCIEEALARVFVNQIEGA